MKILNIFEKPPPRLALSVSVLLFFKANTSKFIGFLGGGVSKGGGCSCGTLRIPEGKIGEP